MIFAVASQAFANIIFLVRFIKKCRTLQEIICSCIFKISPKFSCVILYAVLKIDSIAWRHEALRVGLTWRDNNDVNIRNEFLAFILFLSFYWCRTTVHLQRIWIRRTQTVTVWVTLVITVWIKQIRSRRTLMETVLVMSVMMTWMVTVGPVVFV